MLRVRLTAQSTAAADYLRSECVKQKDRSRVMRVGYFSFFA